MITLPKKMPIESSSSVLLRGEERYNSHMIMM